MKFKNKLFPIIVCPAWVPELNAVEHGPEGKETSAWSPQQGWGAREAPSGPCCSLLYLAPYCPGKESDVCPTQGQEERFSFIVLNPAMH